MKPVQAKPQRAGAPAMGLSHEIDIAAPPERVWAVLTDFASYGEWNPYQTIEGEPKLYGKVHVTSRKLGSGEITQRAQAVLTKLEPSSKLELFSGNVLTWSSLRWFHLFPSPKGTLLRHGVRMSGFLAKRAFKRTHRIERLQPLFAAVSEAAARRAISPSFRQPVKGKGNRHERRATRAKQRN